MTEENSRTHSAVRTDDPKGEKVRIIRRFP